MPATCDFAGAVCFASKNILLQTQLRRLDGWSFEPLEHPLINAEGTQYPVLAKKASIHPQMMPARASAQIMSLLMDKGRLGDTYNCTHMNRSAVLMRSGTTDTYVKIEQAGLAGGCPSPCKNQNELFSKRDFVTFALPVESQEIKQPKVRCVTTHFP